MKNIRTEQKTNIKAGVIRLMIVALMTLAQVIFLLMFFAGYSNSGVAISVLYIVAIIFSIYICSRHLNASIKITWIILIMAFPLFGILLYLFSNVNIGLIITRNRYERIDKNILSNLRQNPKAFEKLKNIDVDASNISKYLIDYCGFPLYGVCDVEYFSEAIDGLRAQIEDIKNAKSFIFMEYFSVEEELIFPLLTDILKQKISEGVEVRLHYDDVGSINFINRKFIKRMAQIGVDCRVFNPVFAFFNLFLNNRDHRKITVIDGEIAYTGGYNLAKEYFNMTSPFGYWKDTGVRFTGPAVDSLTVIFLENWNASKKAGYDTDIAGLLGHSKRCEEDYSKGFIQPFGDTPLDSEHTGENVMLNLTSVAKSYLYITTPYLVITDELSRMLSLAAKRGVDVRVIVPGIPDKKIVYQITRSYYEPLIERGVKIYEYTPGFLHAKQCVCDGDIAYIGTINMDYRSFYHHFEDGVMLYQSHDIINVMKKDFEEMFPVCHRVTLEDIRKRPIVIRAMQSILRIIAPLT